MRSHVSTEKSAIARGVAMLLAVLAGAVAVPGAGAQIAEYRLRIDAGERDVLRVEARLPMNGRTLTLGHGRPHGERSWGSYVRDLQVDAGAGRAPTLHPLGGSRWRVRGRLPERLRISYSILLDHQDTAFPYGHYGASYLRRDCVYFATAAVLIASGAVDRALVRLELPDGWQASTAWASASYRAPEFRVLGRRELLEASVLIGTHRERRFEVEGVEVTLALGSDFAGSEELLESAVRAVIPAATEVFGPLPRQRYLVVVNRSEQPGEDGGAGQYQGVSLLLPEPRGEALDETWVHALTHEFLHMWNGIDMRPADDSGEWFNEGITEYLTATLLGRTGLVDRSYPLRYLTVMFDGYRKQAGGASLAQAGTAKRSRFFFVYGGGMAFGLLLDQEIRSGSGLRFGIADLARRMYDEFGGGRYRLEDIIGIASELAGRDLSVLFDRYVVGEELIPLELALRRLGVEVKWIGEHGRVSIRLLPGVGRDVLELRELILGSLR